MSARQPRTNRGPVRGETLTKILSGEIDAELTGARDANDLVLDLTCCDRPVARLLLSLGAETAPATVRPRNKLCDRFADDRGNIVMVRIRCKTCKLDMPLTAAKHLIRMRQLRQAYRDGAWHRVAKMDIRTFQALA